jgi:mycothiol system anti-sigma-R factor
MTDRCNTFQRFIDAYLDGEFAERDRVELEAHLDECEPCRHKVRLQAEWKRAVRAAAPHEAAPAALRQRVERALGTVELRPRWRRLADGALPVAVAAGVVASLMLSRVRWSPVAADVISKHQRNLPIEISGDREQVRRWYADKVDFPVRPPRFEQAAKQVELRGARLANVRDRQAAYLVYSVNGNKVSVFIFDPGELRLEAPRKQRIGDREVYFDESRGYNVALYRDRGVGYAIASDLDQDQMVKLVSSAVAPSP